MIKLKHSSESKLRKLASESGYALRRKGDLFTLIDTEPGAAMYRYKDVSLDVIAECFVRRELSERAAALGLELQESQRVPVFQGDPQFEPRWLLIDREPMKCTVHGSLDGVVVALDYLEAGGAL